MILVPTETLLQSSPLFVSARATFLRILWWKATTAAADVSMGRGRGSEIGKFMKRKNPKSTLLADNTQGLITTKQTKLRPVASAAPSHHSSGAGMGVNISSILKLVPTFKRCREGVHNNCKKRHRTVRQVYQQISYYNIDLNAGLGLKQLKRSSPSILVDFVLSFFLLKATQDKNWYFAQIKKQKAAQKSHNLKISD